MERLVRWRGVSAEYDQGERQIMRQLPIKEQAFVHLLKSFTDGELTDPSANLQMAPEAEAGRLGTPGKLLAVPPSVYTDPEDIPFDFLQGEGGATPQARVAISDPAVNRTPTQYLNPEDIPFGKPKKTYALAWTPHRIRSFRTRDGKKNPREAVVPRLRTWKRWYERQGWTVFGSDGWHIAKSPDGELHAAIIREYDVERKKRL